MSTKKRPYTAAWCECGAPALNPYGAGRMNGPLANGCERCLRAETIGDGWLKPCGVPVEQFSRDFPRSTIVQIDRACTRWLHRRGLSAAVGHTYIERP